MHEKLDLIKITLEIIQRVTGRVDALFSGSEDAANTMFVRLLNLCSALDSWLDVNIPIEREMPTPLQLRDKTFKVAVDLLRHLGDITTSGGSNPPSWKTLRRILIECLDVAQGNIMFWLEQARTNHVQTSRLCPVPSAHLLRSFLW